MQPEWRNQPQQQQQQQQNASNPYYQGSVPAQHQQNVQQYPHPVHPAYQHQQHPIYPGAPPFPPPQQPPPLPPGWVSTLDPISRRIYYANSSTGETSWEPPKPLQPPPPPPFLHAPLPPIHAQLATPFVPRPQVSPQQRPVLSALSIMINVTPTDPAVSGGLLVPSIRAMMDAEHTARLGSDRTKCVELESLSAGSVADLCLVTKDLKMEQHQLSQRQKQIVTLNSGTEEEEEEEPFVMEPYSEPLRPYDLPVSSRPPHIEPGRVDIRIMALMEQLRNIDDD